MSQEEGEYEFKRAYVDISDVREGLPVIVTEPGIDWDYEVDLPRELWPIIAHNRGFVHLEENENGTIVYEDWVDLSETQQEQLEWLIDEVGGIDEYPEVRR